MLMVYNHTDNCSSSSSSSSSSSNTVMYAIGHIRPHSLFAGPSLSLTRRSPQFIIRLSDLLTCRVAASQLYLRDLFTLAAFARLVRMDK